LKDENGGNFRREFPLASQGDGTVYNHPFIPKESRKLIKSLATVVGG